MEKTSILNEVKKTKRYSKILWIVGILLFLVFLFFAKQWFDKANKKEIEIQYAQTLQRDIKLSVEEDGEIQNPRDFNLSFLMTGKLDQLLVEEGEMVEAGQKLAILNQRELWLQIQSAKANIQSIYAQISRKKSENTRLEFLETQEVLNTSKSNILDTQKTTEQNVKESFALGKVQVEASFYRLKTTLNVIDNIFGIDNSRQNLLRGVFNDSVKLNQIKNDFLSLKRDINTRKQEWDSKKINPEYADISRAMWSTKTLLESSKKLLDSTIYIFSNSKGTTLFPKLKIENSQTQLSQEKSLVHESIKSITSAKKNTEKMLIDQTTKITSAYNKLKENEVRTENAEKMVVQKESYKKSGLSDSYAQLAQARSSLQIAQYNYSLATLTSPAKGEVLHIENEVGEIISAGSRFIKILSDENFIVEIYVEELDIAKIKIGQEANIRIAALDDQEMKGTVFYVSNQATEDENGVITYLVRLEIKNGRDFFIKEKMTASVEFIIDEVQSVITVPLDAIFQNKKGESVVLLADLTEVVVETGLSDNTFIEIKKGLDRPNISIIKNPLDLEPETKKEIVSKKLLPKIKEELEGLGFTEKEIKKIERGEMEDALKSQLQEAQKKGKGGIAKMMKK